MIYVVEDDRGIRELEAYALQQSGYQVQTFEEGKAFLSAMAVALPELVLLDVMLPGDDGYALLKKIKQDPQMREVPVLMVTARDAEMDKVRGLDGGADDYVVKPFGIMELLSRVKAVLRRAGSRTYQQQELVCSGITLDVEKHKVFANGTEVTLTYMEFELLRYLMTNRGMALTREKMLDAVWGMDYAGDTRTVDVHMRSLRVKLGPASACLQTVRGVGYRLEEKNAQKDL